MRQKKQLFNTVVGGSSSSLTYVSIKITPISGGFQDYSVQDAEVAEFIE